MTVLEKQTLRVTCAFLSWQRVEVFDSALCLSSEAWRRIDYPFAEVRLNGFVRWGV